MAEVPSACLLADALAERCSFISIGTNDLVQYTMAADRGNPAVAGIYQQLNPAVLKLVNMCSEACSVKGIELSVCGELAGTPEGAIILAGLGAVKLSMAAVGVAPVAKALASKASDQLRRAAVIALGARTQDEVRRIIESV
jgi:phosphoenolpyruvate-protein kinase (PTS system EI component)